MIGRCIDRLSDVVPARMAGRVRRVGGPIVEAEGLLVPVGAVCEVRASAGPVVAEVIGLRDGAAVLMALGDTRGLRAGDRVVSVSDAPRVPVGDGLIGRVVDGEGSPLDGQGPVAWDRRVAVNGAAPAALERVRSTVPMATGVRVIDGLLTCARGQRVGLFSGSGVGKTTLLGMIARGTAADVIVLGLIGERGREVLDFVERDLGPQGLRRCIVVAETADRPAVRRVKAALAATAMAEDLRDRGRHVLLLVDSLSRVVAAQREIGLAAGESPSLSGHPPSVYALLPRLLERAGSTARGSITAFYTVLAEGDDPNDPIADSARSVLDGHFWLSREAANRGRFPAIDVLASVSRLSRDVVDPVHARAAARIRSLLGAHREAADLLAVGAYARGSDPDVDRAVRCAPLIEEFLRQPAEGPCPFGESRRLLEELERRVES